MTAIDQHNPPSEMTGEAYWRSLEEYADAPEFREMLGRAGMPIDEQQLKGVSRRRFLQLMAASMSLAGLTLTGCRRLPRETIVPFANRPEGMVPGEPTYYATMFEQSGVATGLLAESFDGRPIKIEGNPQHPFSRGATDRWSQASILTLYDPDRSRHPRRMPNGGSRRRWDHFSSFADEHFGQRTDGASARVAVLSAPTSSLTMQVARERFMARFPEARWYHWEPINRDNARRAIQIAFGQALREQLHLDQARIVACFDADPFDHHPAAVRHQHDWAATRRTADEGEMSRVYVAEPAFTTIGSVADERLPVRSSHVPQLVAALAAKLGVGSNGANNDLNGSSRFIEMLAADLTRSENRERSLVIVGEHQPPETQALAWAINEHLGNLGQTVTFIEDPLGDEPGYLEQLRDLVRRMEAGDVETLLILGVNPVYDAPADLDFTAALERVDTKIHHGLYIDETAAACDWHLPQAHYLESWGDGRAWDGTVSIQQPMILPLFEGRTAIELIALLADERETDGYELVRAALQQVDAVSPGEPFETGWRNALHRGLIEGSAANSVEPTLRDEARTATAANPQAAASDLEVIFRPDTKMFDGRWANNGWLQELPEPRTHLTWDNAAWMSPADAQRLGVKRGDMLTLSINGRELELPALPMPGQIEGAIIVTLGYGRRASGHVGTEVGFDTYRLRTAEAMHVVAAEASATGRRYRLATTTHHDLLDQEYERYGVQYRAGRKDGSGTIIRSATLDHYRRNPNFVEGVAHGDIGLQLFSPPMPDEWNEPAWDGAPAAFNKPHAWGMAVDMNACTGCSACVIACQSENNIPVVGKDEVLVHRELHWLRIDRYYRGDVESPDVVHQPMMCVHCENAPCEQVCPVNATLHDSEGLNLQVYNRCVGTRYCSNNCPYKVRRYNFLDYHSQDPRGGRKPWLGIPDQQQLEQVDRIKQMVFNPNVTVRMRGVMEKCTYCIQRISRARIKAKNEHARGERAESTVRDGEVVTACQSACPTGAIVFGDLNDPNSRVSHLHRNNRSYKVLGPELNTRPRTAHLAKIRNPANV